MKSVLLLGSTFALAGLLGCSTLQKGADLATAAGADQLALKAIEDYAAAKGLPISLTAKAAVDPFAAVPATYSEWVDANGKPIAFPITRTVTKEFKETVGATTVSTLQPAPAVAVDVSPAASSGGGGGIYGSGGFSGDPGAIELSAEERAALEKLGVPVPVPVSY